MEKIQLFATTLTPRVQRWLQTPTVATMLHLFEEAINLTGANGEIISVVRSQIKPGPFSIVVDEKRPFTTLVPPAANVTKTANSLSIGPLEIECRQAQLWQPMPNWQLLRESQSGWQNRLPEMQTAVTNDLNRIGDIGPANFTEQFGTTIADMQAVSLKADPGRWQTAVTKLAGFGPGFTPAGDDFLVGFLFGLWATQSQDEVMKLAKIVVDTAVPRTTKLSAAWLQAAGRGEAWLPWHELVAALCTGHGWQRPIQRILNQGATSGISALLGFIVSSSKS